MTIYPCDIDIMGTCPFNRSTCEGCKPVEEPEEEYYGSDRWLEDGYEAGLVEY